jgi:hypothetical protein
MGAAVSFAEVASQDPGPSGTDRCVEAPVLGQNLQAVVEPGKGVKDPKVAEDPLGQS